VNMKKLNGLGAILTGSGSGIGRAMAAAFVAEGAVVACLDINADWANRSAREAGGGSIGIACDVTDPAAVEAAVAEAVAKLPPVKVLVNGAATRDRTATVVELTPEEWNRTIAVNLTSAFLVSRAVIPHMAKAGGGSIIHIASQLGKVGSPGRPIYCASKGALIQLAKVMAVDHAGENIRVNALCPGAIETERLEERFGSIEGSRAALGPKHPIGRLGTAAEIAEAALFLASEASAFMTGAELVVDGGYTAV